MTWKKCWTINLFKVPCHCTMTMCFVEHPGSKQGNFLNSRYNNQAMFCCLVLGLGAHHCILGCHNMFLHHHFKVFNRYKWVAWLARSTGGGGDNTRLHVEITKTIFYTTLCYAIFSNNLISFARLLTHRWRTCYRIDVFLLYSEIVLYMLCLMFLCLMFDVLVFDVMFAFIL